MRIGDFAVDVVPRGKGIGIREIGSGHVLARPGQVYALRLRNSGPLRCVAEVSVDGSVVTAGGLVLEPYCTEELERPIAPDEDGRFTVVAEGDERVFGPDGGRDNPDLGLIQVRFRRELPGGPERPRPLPPTLAAPSTRTRLSRLTPDVLRSVDPADFPHSRNEIRSLLLGRDAAPSRPSEDDLALDDGTPDDIERAAGTGLTGHSAQRFVPTQLGPLEREATVIQLRLVIASVEAIQAASSLVDEQRAPERPAARP
ncbi:MAG TPA: hypothetical protein VJO33_07680 [Gemmatimonadaceae bacterium]|nr:hypothetical protein [Gemmatimonadaceae bacterium]